jgi:ABC-type glutathione transport system ATPase component
VLAVEARICGKAALIAMNRLEMDTPPPLLRVDNLQVELGAPARPVRPVDGVSFTLPAGQTLALVSEVYTAL